MISTLSTYGFDPGLTHGAIVLSTFDLSESHHLCTEVQVLHTWRNTKKIQHGLKAKSTPVEINQFVSSVLIPKFKLPAVQVGIEFSPHSVYWRAQKSQVVSLAYMLGYLNCGLNYQGLPVTQITVDQLKMAFEIRGMEKAEYMKKPIKLKENKPLRFKNFTFGQLHRGNDDIFDAFLLSYLTAYLISRRTN